jgi:hypothetical protein
MSHNITIKGGEAKRLPTAGKYCDRDIVITAEKGGIDLPNLTNEGRAEDLIAGRQLIDSNGSVVIGTLGAMTKLNALADSMALSNEQITYKRKFTSPLTITSEVSLNRPAAEFGNATADMVAKGNTFTSINGINIEGLAEVRTSDDITMNSETAIVSVPRGFYEASTEKEIDTTPYYNSGYTDGYRIGDGKGYDRGLSVGETRGYNNGLTDGVLKLKAEEGKDTHDITVNGVFVSIPKGYYAKDVVKIADDSDAFNQGITEGRKQITEGEARNEEDITIVDTYINIPFGYYGRDMSKYFDVSPYFYDGWLQGFEGGVKSVVLPDIRNQGTADDLLQGKQLIDGNKNIITGNIVISHGGIFKKANEPKYGINGGVPTITLACQVDKPLYISPKTGSTISLNADAVNFGYATTDMVMQGATFTSKNGINLVGTAQKRTDADAIYADLSVIMPEGFYQSGVVINTERYYEEGYEDGLAEGGGGELPTLTNAGTAADLLKGKQLIDGSGNIVNGAMPIADIEEVAHDVDASVVVIPSGYYEKEEEIDVGNHWQYGYELGWHDGFDEGSSQGGGGELHHLLYEQIQSENVVRINANMYCYDVNIFGSSIDYESTFDDYVDREYSSLSSNPLTISVDNYTNLYLYLYLRVKDKGNDEQYITTVIVPPQGNNSVDITSHLSMNERTEWQTEIIGARFSINEI